jgi:hypothetical protein
MARRGKPLVLIRNRGRIFQHYLLPRGRLLTNTSYCCIETFRAIRDKFDRLVGAGSIKIGLAIGSRENR